MIHVAGSREDEVWISHQRRSLVNRRGSERDDQVLILPRKNSSQIEFQRAAKRRNRLSAIADDERLTDPRQHLVRLQNDVLRSNRAQVATYDVEHDWARRGDVAERLQHPFDRRNGTEAGLIHRLTSDFLRIAPMHDCSSVRCLQGLWLRVTLAERVGIEPTPRRDAPRRRF